MYSFKEMRNIQLFNKIENKYNSQFFRDQFSKSLSFYNVKKKKSLSSNIYKRNNFQKSYFPLIKVKNFQITSYKFKKFLDIHENYENKNIGDQRKKSVFNDKLKKTFSSSHLKKMISNSERYSINLDYNIFTREMKEKRIENDNIMEEILNQDEIDKRNHLKLISYQLNIPFIKESEKKRREIIRKKSLILTTLNKKL